MRTIDELNKLIEEVKLDMINAGVPFNDNCPISLNRRLSRALGKCKYKKNLTGHVYAFSIEINELYFECAKENDLKNTICHELIHSAPECVYCRHRGLWKEYCKVMEDNYPNKYIIRRTTYSKEYVEELRKKEVNPYKYEVYCPKCGATWRRKSKCKLIQHPNYYSCGRCNTDLKVRVVGGR